MTVQPGREQKGQSMTFDEAYYYIEETPKFTKKHSLEYMRECLERLGNPDRSFRVIHVAGTNGKGSTCAFLFSVLRKAGYRCGLFTSPHLENIRERFFIGDEMAGEEEFLRAFHTVYSLSEELSAGEKGRPTYFEMLFLIGMLIFRERRVEYAVLETGMGGRLDATTAADPIACVITSVSLDHMQYLGNTVAEIAGEKAGIIVPGVPVIYDACSTEAARVIERRAAESGCRRVPVRKEDAIVRKKSMEGIDFYFKNEYYDNTVFHIPSIAEYQVLNAMLAVRTLSLLDEDGHIHVSREQMVQGISDTVWPGRMEMILPGVILDGAHNEDGIEKFIDTAEHFQKDYVIGLLFSAVNDKDYQKMIRTICTRLKLGFVVATQAGGSRQTDAEEIAGLFLAEGCRDVTVMKNPGEAVRCALKKKGDGMMLFVVGSLYLIGEVRPVLRELRGLRSTGKEVMKEHDRLRGRIEKI